MLLHKELRLQTNSEWQTGVMAWDNFVKNHPELGYHAGKYQFHNFLRLHRESLVTADALRKARGHHWIAHTERFNRAAFDAATGKSLVAS